MSKDYNFQVMLSVLFGKQREKSFVMDTDTGTDINKVKIDT